MIQLADMLNNTHCIGTTEFSQFYLADVMELLQGCPEAPAIIFADPPFNIGVDYASPIDDALPDEQYRFWMYKWLDAAAELLADNGSLWLNIPDKWVASAVEHARWKGLKLENWCIWHYRFGTWQPKRFIVSKTHALWFSKGNPIVNPEAVLVPSDRASIYSDKRVDGNAGWRMDLDVWGFDRFWGRVQGNNVERRPLHPNQLPETYLERIIKLCSNEGQIVVDPFCGSGTSACVAESLKRYCITGDLSQLYLQSALERTRGGRAR